MRQDLHATRTLRARPQRLLHWGLLCAAAACAAPAAAQFSMVPAPLCAPPRASDQEVEQEFRLDAARHLYACYPMRVYRGKLPPLLYGIMMVELEIDANGTLVGTQVIRKPAADEVAPWVLAMIRRASPFPAPVKMAMAAGTTDAAGAVRSTGTTVKFTETYFVDKTGLFQTMSLTEGQR
jgi:hypothetical protein